METVKVTKLSNDVIHIIYLNSRITLDDIQHAFEQCLNIMDGPLRLMISGNRIRYADYDALKITGSPEFEAKIFAQAIVTKTIVERLLGRLYIKTHPTRYLNECFLDEVSALEWLASKA